ncbi:uncharacterized protein LOC6576413 isoform X1 [Drosophila mojavensis]|uniref:Uncharacterized protein n=1 Tax=Drosophila mojavensis TaxID=7230 RepID=B4KEA1_DROMO|nr:uncharacterized protein LOC6576413 isoform X1 [Drosophila mojavensis]EDW11846.2 uncharacterized protein Dmoj_GI17367 [Drosophila mojavensis]
MFPMADVGLLSYHSVNGRKLDRQKDECSHKTDSSGSLFSMQEHMLRTQLLLLDYKQFKAARTIQRHVRGFILRQRMQRELKAAIVIQRAWRRCVAKRHLIIFAQERTQDAIQIKYYNASLKIQAFFRGWWSRKHINNMLFLKNMQLQYVEELLNTFALKLHTMMRTGHLPGYVSLCVEPSSSKVKDLLMTLTYRFYNRYVCNKYMTTKKTKDKYCREFMDAAYWTWVPYMGFNHNGVCHKWVNNYDMVPKVYALREYDVAQVFMSQALLSNLHKKQLLAKEKEARKSVRYTATDYRFCRDIANSMKYWRICKVCKDKVTDSLMGDQFQEYLNEVKLHLESMQFGGNCPCSRDKKQEDHLKCISPSAEPALHRYSKYTSMGISNTTIKFSNLINDIEQE